MSLGYQYVDGIRRVSVMNGMAHIEMVVVEPSAEKEGERQVTPVQKLVMTLPQFIRLCADMASQLKRLEDQGVITREPTANSGEATNH